MKLDSGKHKRLPLRLSTHDYTKPACYFITIHTQNFEFPFGKITGKELKPNIYGEIVLSNWMWLGKRHAYIYLDVWSLLPDHMHGIIRYKYSSQITDNHSSGRSRAATSQDGKAINNSSGDCIKIKPLGQIIGAFKTRSTKYINQINNTPGRRIWQRSFHDRIIRDKNEYFAIRQYILDNPKNWPY